MAGVMDEVRVEFYGGPLDGEQRAYPRDEVTGDLLRFSVAPEAVWHIGPADDVAAVQTVPIRELRYRGMHWPSGRPAVNARGCWRFRFDGYWSA